MGYQRRVHGESHFAPCRDETRLCVLGGTCCVAPRNGGSTSLYGLPACSRAVTKGKRKPRRLLLVLPLPLPVARDQFWRERSVLQRSVLEGNRMKRLTSILTITCMTIRVFLKGHFVKVLIFHRVSFEKHSNDHNLTKFICSFSFSQ